MSTIKLRARPPRPGRLRPPADDDYLSVAEVGLLYPGRPRQVASVVRHIVAGICLADGRRLRLKARRTPSGWVVSRRDFEEFLSTLTDSYRAKHGLGE
jgi:hypothetical protein